MDRVCLVSAGLLCAAALFQDRYWVRVRQLSSAPDTLRRGGSFIADQGND